MISNPLQRRAVLATHGNPAPALDYLVSLEGRIALGAAGGDVAGGGATVALCYVPDRLVVERGAFAAYLGDLSAAAWPSLEALGTVLLGDLNDVLVPRWLRVTLHHQAGDGIAHGLRLEDRQPRWVNDRLLTGV